MKPLRVAEAAFEDLRLAEAWLEGERPGLGRRFVDTIEGVFQSIGEAPARFPVVHRDVGRALARPFPDGVYFRDLPERVRVVAVVHLHRSQRAWRARR
jgi:toxin ParE1/3/4